MAVRDNELYIGTQFLNIEGRSIKHPALIRYYATVNHNKLGDAPLDTIGVDIETNAATGEMMLLGFYDRDKGYQYYTDDFVKIIFMMVKHCANDQKALAYWNRLDPFVILRTLLQTVDHATAERAMMRFGKESGEWDNKNKKWDIAPIFSAMYGDHEFGIKNVIRSSIQFYYINHENEKMKTVWAFDIAGLYMNGLEKEAKSRFSWYSKVDESAHLVDWIDFASDKHYREDIVLKSNKYDARAAMELAYHIQDDFYKAFKTYPKSLVSQGSLARTAIVADIKNNITDLSGKALEKEIKKQVKSIGIMNYYDEWATKYGGDFMKDLYCLFTEAYSGGYIDSISYGYTPEGWYADIASAYPGIIQDLYDLTNATWEKGTGTPKRAKKGYTFIRGTVKIPSHIDYHPITVKHPLYKDTNIRPTGTFKASYIIEERDHLLELGATFEDEEWYMIETSGEKSSLAHVCTNFVNLRKELKAAGNSAEYMAKIAANSLYGILFEAVDTHNEFELDKEIIIDEYRHNDYKDILKEYKHEMNLESIRPDLKYIYGDQYQTMFYRWHATGGKMAPDEVAQELSSKGIHIKSINPVDIIEEIDDLYTLDAKSINKETVTVKKIKRDGYRAGEFWNPLYATIITAKTRVLMSQAANAIQDNGGQPIILMTDSITWKGTKDMMPSKYVREIKTLGYYEPPEKVKDIICLGSGRYGFKLKNKETGAYTDYEAKRRGLNAVAIHDKNGHSLGSFDWQKVLQEMEKNNSTTINVSVRTLISPGMVYLSNKYDINDLGRIIDQNRKVKAIVGKTKRDINKDLENPYKLNREMIKTDSLFLDPAMFGKVEISDQTLPLLRRYIMKKELKTRKEKKQTSWKKASDKYYSKNRINQIIAYKKLIKQGYNRENAKKMCKWSDERLKKEKINISL